MKQLLSAFICGTLLLPILAQYSSNISQTGDIRIITTNGIMTCDTLVCPKSTVKCVATKKTTSNLQSIVRRRKCLDENDVVLKDQSVTEPNPFPGSEISDYAEASASGSNSIIQQNVFDDNNNRQATEFIQSLNNYNRRMHSSMADMQAQMNQRMQEQMNNMFNGMW